MTHALPENAFYKLARQTGFHGSATSDENRLFRPSFADNEATLEEFFGELLSQPYAREQSYYVLTNRNNKDIVKHSFAKFSNEHGAKFSAMCFFPKIDEITLALPKDAFSRLPEELWEHPSTIQANKYDKNYTTKENDLVIYMDHQSLNTCRVEFRPTFGTSVRSRCSKYINVNRLKQWLATREGKAFHQAELYSVLEADTPHLLRNIQSGVTIEALIQKAKEE